MYNTHDFLYHVHIIMYSYCIIPVKMCGTSGHPTSNHQYMNKLTAIYSSVSADGLLTMVLQDIWHAGLRNTLIIPFYRFWLHAPPQWQRPVHARPAAMHLHRRVEHKGSVLQPHFKSSLQAFAASGNSVQTGLQDTLLPLAHPNPSGLGACCWCWMLVVQILAW